MPLDQVQAAEGDHITRARTYLAMAAPAFSRLQVALTLGTSPEELDKLRGGARLMLESIKQAHAVVGLRAGEDVSLDLSDRMQTFLTRWQERRALQPEALVLEGEARVIMEGEVPR